MINLSSEPYEVAIAGAGPTGLVTAALLGLAGIRTLLIERNAGTVNEPRAVSIDDESLRTMQACGLIDEVLANVAQDYGSIYVDPEGAEFARVMPTLKDYGYPRRNAFRQPILEATLRDGLSRFPHVDVRFGHALEGFAQDDTGVTLTITDVEGRTGTARAQYLAAADGGRSLVRKAIGAKLEGSSFEERWLIIDLARTEDPLRETRVTCDPDRPAISLPGPAPHPPLRNPPQGRRDRRRHPAARADCGAAGRTRARRRKPNPAPARLHLSRPPRRPMGRPARVPAR